MNGEDEVSGSGVAEDAPEPDDERGDPNGDDFKLRPADAEADATATPVA